MTVINAVSAWIVRGLVLLACLQLSACKNTRDGTIAPGRYPPSFELQGLDGRTYKLDDFSGKLVLLNFWASWCTPCIEELPALQGLYARLKDKGFVVIGIGIDDDERSLREFKERFGLSFPVLVDKDGGLKSRYRISGVPESFVIGRDGKLLMLPDPEDNEMNIKIVGPREWNSPNVIARFEELLRQ